jgi:hypothetical protein
MRQVALVNLIVNLGECKPYIMCQTAQTTASAHEHLRR